MSTAACLPYKGDDVWLLASATVYDVREVATEINSRPASIHTLIQTIEAVFFMMITVIPDLKRLAVRQGKLVAKLKSARKEKWTRDDCGALASLLRDLIVDETDSINNGMKHLRYGRTLIARHIGILQSQLRDLDEICYLLEALALQEISMAGDVDCREFLSALAGPEEFDFSDCPPSRKRSALHA